MGLDKNAIAELNAYKNDNSAQLELKANQSDLDATSAIVALKADKSEVTNVMTPKGNIAYASLPTSGNTIGDYYYCPDGDGVNGAGNYVWNGTVWYFGGTGDDGYNILKDDLTNEANERLAVFDNPTLIWESGSVTSSGGKADLATKMRLQTMIYVKSGSTITCDNDYTLRVLEYSQPIFSLTYLLKYTDGVANYTVSVNSFIVVVVAKKDGSTITEAEIGVHYNFRLVSGIKDSYLLNFSYNRRIVSEFESGGIDYATGLNIDNIARIRTSRFIPVNAGSKVVCADDKHLLCCVEYESNGNESFGLLTTTAETGYLFVHEYIVKNNCYIRLSIKNYDESSFSFVPNDVEIHIYDAEKTLWTERFEQKFLRLEQGSIDSTWGTNIDDVATLPTRRRTIAVQAKKGSWIEPNSGYQIMAYELANDTVYAPTILTKFSTWATSRYTIKNNCYVRVAIMKTDGSAFAIQDNPIHYYIVGQKTQDLYKNFGFVMPPSTYTSVGYNDNAIFSKTLAEVYTMYDSLLSEGYISKELLGTDQSNTYDIYAYRVKPLKLNISGGNYIGQGFYNSKIPKIVITGVVHGSEKPTALTLYNFLYNLKNRWLESEVLTFLRWHVEFVIIPLVNPYGFAMNQRGNSRNVDLNRNFNVPAWVNGVSDTSSIFYRNKNNPKHTTM